MDTPAAPAPDLDWKGMLLSKPAANLVLAMIVKWTKVDLPVAPMRVLFAIAMLLHAVLLTMQLWAIRRAPPGPEITVKELDMQTERGYVERTYTHKKYDDKQVNQQIKLLGMQMIVTAAIHIMARMSTPLLLACTQPIFQMFEPVFRARVLGQKIEVKRPTPDPILESQIRRLEQKEKDAELDQQHETRKAAKAAAKARKKATSARPAIDAAEPAEPAEDAVAETGFKKDL